MVEPAEIDLTRFFGLTTNPLCVINAEGVCLRINPAFERLLNRCIDLEKEPFFSSLTHPYDVATNRKRVERIIKKRLDLASNQREPSSDTSNTSTSNTEESDSSSDRAGSTRLKPATRLTLRYLRPFEEKTFRKLSSDSDSDAPALKSTESLPKPTDEVIWIEWRFIADPASRVFYCVGRDLTRRIKQVVQVQGRYSGALKDKHSGIARAAIARKETTLYTQAIQSIPIGLFILRLDDPDNAHSLRLITTNPRASEYTGVQTENHIGDLLVDIFPNLRGSGIPEIYAQVTLNNQTVDVGEVVYADDRVKKGIFAVKAFPLGDRCVGVVFENITERKLREEDLVTANLMLTDLTAILESRNQELDQFAYVASHDLKAPLRAISSLASWIEEDIGDALPPENKEQLDLLRSRVSRMEGLINGLLTYSRVGRLTHSKQEVDVQKMLTDIVGYLITSDSIKVDIAAGMPTIRTQRALLSQVFTNIISNAIRHRDKKTGHIRISARKLTDSYEFAISDDGPGIEPSYHEKIFTIFQTLKPRDEHENIGIGLSIVRKILKEVGGSITVDSDLGKGTTFRFVWPLK